MGNREGNKEGNRKDNREGNRKDNRKDNRKEIRKEIRDPDRKQIYGDILTSGAYALKTVFRYAPGVAGMYAVLSLTSSVCSVAQILVLRGLVDGVYSYVRRTGGGGSILLWGSLYLAALTASAVYGLSRNKLNWYLRRRLTKSLTPAIVEKFSRMEYQYFENAEFQDVISRMSQDPQEKIHAAFLNVVDFVMHLLTLLGILGIFFGASLWIGMGAVLIGVPMSVLKIYAVSRRNRILGEATMDQRMGEYQQNLFADKDAAYEIKVFRAREHILHMWYETTDKIMKRAGRIQRELIQVESIGDLLKIVYAAFAVAALTSAFLAGNIGLGVLVSVLQSVEKLFSAIGNVSFSISDLGRAAFEISYLKEFLGLAEETGRGEETVEKGGEIVFDHVSFRYPGTDREILHDVSFCIRSGEKVALVGVNGAGKSTVVKLLCGLYRPDSGHITVGGKDINTLSRRAIRQYLTAVFQDFGAYQLTLRENIAFGDLDRIGEDGRLMEALAQADSGELSGLGLDTNLGKLAEDGVDVSRGQWQRIALARAFLSPAEFVVLDEPTASLDPIAESRVYQSFGEVLRKRGAIMISHRLASARMAQRIFVLEGGEVVESGSHEELMKNGGLYAVMYEEQSGWYKEEAAGAGRGQLRAGNQKSAGRKGEVSV